MPKDKQQGRSSQDQPSRGMDRNQDNRGTQGAQYTPGNVNEDINRDIDLDSENEAMSRDLDVGEDMGDTSDRGRFDTFDEDDEDAHNPNVDKSRGMKERERDNIE